MKSGVVSLKTSYHRALQFHFLCPHTSRLPPDASVSPLRNFPRSSTPSYFPAVNQFLNAVSSWCHDFSYPAWKFHCFFWFGPYPTPHLPKLYNLNFNPSRKTCYMFQTKLHRTLKLVTMMTISQSPILGQDDWVIFHLMLCKIQNMLEKVFSSIRQVVPEGT